MEAHEHLGTLRLGRDGSVPVVALVAMVELVAEPGVLKIDDEKSWLSIELETDLQERKRLISIMDARLAILDEWYRRVMLRLQPIIDDDNRRLWKKLGLEPPEARERGDRT